MKALPDTQSLCDTEPLFYFCLLSFTLIAIPCSSPPKLHQVLVQLQSGDKEQDFSLAPIQVSISVQLWRLPGCHEFLAALGETRNLLALNKNNCNSLKKSSQVKVYLESTLSRQSAVQLRKKRGITTINNNKTQQSNNNVVK